MYKEKLDQLFTRAPKEGLRVIENLKQLVRYQNFCIEVQILSQARNHGVEISNETIMQKDKQRILEHDKAIKAIVNINEIAKECRCSQIFDFEPHRITNQISEFDHEDHTKVAYIVADFINEYYNLGLELGRQDRALDDTTYNKTKTIPEKEWDNATERFLPDPQYYEERLDNAPEKIKEDIERNEEQLDALKKVLDREDQVDITLFNNVEMSIKKNDDYEVTLTSQKPFNETSGILRQETIAGFSQTKPNEMSAKDLFLSQIKEIIKDNGGISHSSREKYNLDNIER